MARDDDGSCHYLDVKCTDKRDCTSQCSKADYKNGGVCIPNSMSGGTSCCCIITSN